MDLTEIRKQLSVRGKNGIAFLLAASIVWTVITVVFIQPIALVNKNIIMLFICGIMFPLSIVMSRVIKAEWLFKDVPLANLGLVLNVAQLVYYPIVIWALAKNPEEMVVFFAIIVGAHFLPYGWLYNAPAFYIMAPIISVMMFVIGFYTDVAKIWLIPISMVFFLLILIVFLYMDYRKKLTIVPKTEREINMNND